MTALATGDARQAARRLALGTVQFGLAYGVANQTGQVSLAEAHEIVRTAVAGGIDTIDTAIGYGDSERILGEIGVQELKLVTKLPAMPADTVDVTDWVNGQMAASLARLGVAQVYGVLLHRPLQLLEANGQALYRALAGLQERSLVRKIGVSIYAPAELEALTARFRFDLVQGPFNLLDRRLHTSGWLQRLKELDIEIHTRSAFLQGLLLMPRDAIPAKFARWDALWERWHQWLQSHKETAVRACLAFPLGFPEIDRVLVGADSAAQLRQILAGVTPGPMATLPDLSCEAEELINPANWPAL